MTKFHFNSIFPKRMDIKEIDSFIEETLQSYLFWENIIYVFGCYWLYTSMTSIHSNYDVTLFALNHFFQV